MLHTEYQITLHDIPIEVYQNHIFPYLEFSDIAALLQVNKKLKTHIEKAQFLAKFIEVRQENNQGIHSLNHIKNFYKCMSYVCMDCDWMDENDKMKTSGSCGGIAGMGLGIANCATDCWYAKGCLISCLISNNALFLANIGVGTLSFAVSTYLFRGTCLLSSCAHRFFSNEAKYVETQQRWLKERTQEEIKNAIKTVTAPSGRSMLK